MKEEYGSIEEANRNAELQMRDLLAGTTAESLADSIKQGVLSGKKTFADFADDIEGFLRNAVLAGLETDSFKERTQKLHEALSKFTSDGVITTEEREQFNQMYLSLIEETRQKQELLNQAGINVIKEQENANSLQGAIKGMTQDTAEVLSGHIAGLRLDVKDMSKDLKSSGAGAIEKISRMIEIQMDIERNTRKTANNTDKLHSINEVMERIEKNTKPIDTKANGF